MPSEYMYALTDACNMTASSLVARAPFHRAFADPLQTLLGRPGRERVSSTGGSRAGESLYVPSTDSLKSAEGRTRERPRSGARIDACCDAAE